MAKLSNKEIRKMVQQKILEALESGVNPWRKPWSSEGGSVMPHNCISGHQYRGVNVPFLMAMQQLGAYPTAQWLSFRQAKKAGGTVRKGEKASYVIFTKPLNIKEKDKDTGEQVDKRIFMLRVTPVFNIAQCDGVSLPKREQGEAVEPLQTGELVSQIQGLMEEAQAKVNYGGMSASYNPRSDTIQLPPVAAFRSEEGFASTALHELVHWTGHGSRLERVGIVNFDGFGSKQYAFEELVAELGSAILGEHYSVSNETENHASYIKSWAEVIKADDRAIFRAARLAECAADYVFPRAAEEELREAA